MLPHFTLLPEKVCCNMHLQIYVYCFTNGCILLSRARASEKPANELILGEEVTQVWTLPCKFHCYDGSLLQCIHETLLDMRFRISPDAFFQVNTPAAEVVYSLVQELCTTEKPSVIYGQFSTMVSSHHHGNRFSFPHF